MKYSLVGIKRFVLVAVLLSSLAVAAVSATDLDVSMDGLAIFIVMELAGAAFTAFTISILLILDFVPRTSCTTAVWAEISALGAALLLMIVAGALTAGEGLVWCPGLVFDGHYCAKWSIMQAFTVLIWVLLTMYLIALITLAVRAHRRGMRGWRTSVREGFEVPAIHQRILIDENELSPKVGRQEVLRGQVV